MRHRTALPFLDAFLKPTKHIHSGLFLLNEKVAWIRTRDPPYASRSTAALPTELRPFHYSICNFCEIKKKRRQSLLDTIYLIISYFLVAKHSSGNILMFTIEM